jgi:hypothetical protein
MSLRPALLALCALLAAPRAAGECPDSCNGHGRCVGPSQCQCFSQWEGPSCADRECAVRRRRRRHPCRPPAVPAVVPPPLPPPPRGREVGLLVTWNVAQGYARLGLRGLASGAALTLRTSTWSAPTAACATRKPGSASAKRASKGSHATAVRDRGRTRDYVGGVLLWRW